MMKPAKVKPLSPIMERHTPQHPLPEEIKNLPQDETVCQFCGVSYLIHHEIKKLEEKVAELENELEENHGAVQREQKLKDELEKTKNAVEYINQLLKQKDKVISKITFEVEDLKSTDEKLRNEVACEQQKRNTIANNFVLYKQMIKSFFTKYQKDATFLRSELDKIKSEAFQMKNDVAGSISSILLKIPEFAKSYIKDLSSVNTRNEELEMNLKNANSESELWKRKYSEKEKDVEQLQESLRVSDVSLQNHNDQLKQKICELENDSKDLNLTLKASDMQLKSLQANAALMEDKLKKKQTELQNAVFKLQKTEENATDTIQRLTQECRNSERQLGIAREELRKVREAQKEKEKREEELCQQSTLHNFQIEEIKRLLADSKATNQSLIEERSLMVMSHQHQIEQLRSNFKRMLEESDGSIKAQKEIEMLHEKHKEALLALEQNLKSEFRVEMGVEKDKHFETLTTLKTQLRTEITDLETWHQKEASFLKNQVAALTQKLELLDNNMEAKRQECEQEKHSLKELISQLENRITQLTGEQEDNVALNKLEIVAASQKLQETLKEKEKLEETIISMKEEISLLQDTVRRECEERFELTEALSQARQYLKESKAPNSAWSNSVVPIHPISALNKLNPSGIEAEPCSKLSNRTLRTLEADYASPQPGLVRSGPIPSLRSLPDVLPKRDFSQVNSRSSTSDTNPVSANIMDISFGSRELAPKRSLSNTSLHNGHQSPGKNTLYSPGGSKTKTHSESSDSVDHVRKRIAAAIKRK